MFFMFLKKKNNLLSILNTVKNWEENIFIVFGV